jgi:hypothetical protein
MLNKDLIDTSLNSYRSKVVQRVYEILALNYRAQLSETILNRSGHELDKLINDQHGNHVKKRVIEKGFAYNMHLKKEKWPAEKLVISSEVHKLGKLLDKIRSDMYSFCMHPLGCRVVQKIIECIPFNFLHDLVLDKLLNTITFRYCANFLPLNNFKFLIPIGLYVIKNGF